MGIRSKIWWVVKKVVTKENAIAAGKIVVGMYISGKTDNSQRQRIRRARNGFA